MITATMSDSVPPMPPDLPPAPRESPPPDVFCPECGYDLRGIPEGVCPECGFHYQRKALKRLVSQAGLKHVVSLQSAAALQVITCLGGVALSFVRTEACVLMFVIGLVAALAWLTLIRWVLDTGPSDTLSDDVSDMATSLRYGLIGLLLLLITIVLLDRERRFPWFVLVPVGAASGLETWRRAARDSGLEYNCEIRPRVAMLKRRWIRINAVMVVISMALLASAILASR